MRNAICLAAAMLLSGCAQPDYRISDTRDTLERAQPPETLAEEIRREAQSGCLSAGSSRGCHERREELGELLAPPRYPEGVTPPTRVGPVPPLPAPPPPPPAPPSRDD